MADKQRNSLLRVFLNGRLVGVLTRRSSGAVHFNYDQDWLAWEHALPISLSLPLREDTYIGEPVTTFFDNLLPDNNVIRQTVAGRVGAEGIDAFSLLGSLGKDCVGALQFLPEHADAGISNNIVATPINHAKIGKMLGNLEVAPLGLDADNDFRISIAGAQEKTALLLINGVWHKPLGTTPTTHIFKPSIGRLPNGIDLSDSVENEYFCLKWLQALGLPSAKVEMTEFDGRKTLIVERFDRQWTADGRLLRLPQEDCCQALSVPWTLKYESHGGPDIKSILDLLRASDSPTEDRRKFLMSQVAFWLLAATDGHAKNFSVFLLPRGRFHLTPLYDVISAQPSIDSAQVRRNQIKLAMAVGKNRHWQIYEIMPRHFIQTAAMSGMGAKLVEDIFEELIASAELALDKVTSQLPNHFPQELVASIGNGVKERLKRIRPKGIG
jgi:serine/threonine-protein kinase HipA